MSGDAVERLRRQIAASDRAILDAVNRRLRLVAELRAHKAAHGIDFVDPEQESRLVSALDAANEGPLSRNGLHRLFSELLALTKRELDEPKS